jgi:hypothetical protein
MIEWLGGIDHLMELSLPLFGLFLFSALSRVIDTNRSKQYFLRGFGCWFGFELLVGLEEGTLVSVPLPVGIVGSILLLIGFLGFTGYGFVTVLGGGESSLTSSP